MGTEGTLRGDHPTTSTQLAAFTTRPPAACLVLLQGLGIQKGCRSTLPAGTVKALFIQHLITE